MFLAAITFASCSSDDDNSFNIDESLIVGEWTITDFDYDVDTTTSFEGQSITASATAVGSNFDYNIIFNKDNTLVADGSYDVTLETTVAGQSVGTETTTVSNIETSGEWSIDGDQLTFSGFTTGDMNNNGFGDDVSKSTSTITILNENTLQIVSDFEDLEGSGSDLPDGAELSVTGSAVMTLSRVN
ncbi:hypothetical protein OD90_1290 [Dokdonia sp. Hel_I_53]|nr:hypothetical protein OD90_1290 [Dokdonia sp. Hel_I_53]